MSVFVNRHYKQWLEEMNNNKRSVNQSAKKFSNFQLGKTLLQDREEIILSNITKNLLLMPNIQ